MFKKKTLKVPSVKNSFLSVKGFTGGLNGKIESRLLSLNYSSLSYNFDNKSGALTDGMGVKEMTFPLAGGTEKTLSFPNVVPSKLYYFKRYDQVNKCYDDRILAYCSDGYIYGASVGGTDTVFVQIPELMFSSAPIGLHYKYNTDDVMVFSCGNKIYIYSVNETLIVDNVPNITSMCFHYERLFVTTDDEGTTLWFSDDFDPSNWDVSLTEAGFIDMQDERGKLIKVVSFLDYLYVFRLYGITRITAYGDQSDYDVSQLFTSGGKIFAGSITTCGDRILFLSSDGLYCFDGLETTKIMSGIFPFIDIENAENCFSEYIDGIYYLKVPVVIDGIGQSALIVYDVTENNGYLSCGTGVTDMCAAKSSVYALLMLTGGSVIATPSDICLNFSSAMSKLWRSPQFDFGSSERKIIRTLSVSTSGELNIRVISDSACRNLIAHSGTSVLDVDLTGENFIIELTSAQSNAKISNLYVKYSNI